MKLRAPGHSGVLRARLVVAAGGVLLALLAFGGAGAAPPAVPGSVQPGRIPGKFTETPQPSSTPEVALPEQAAAPAPDKAAAIRFVLTELRITGNTVLGVAELSAFYTPYIGREISLLDLYAIRDVLTAAYRNRGYVLTQALVPAQRIKGGIVEIHVVEAGINSVRFAGDADQSDALLNGIAARIQRDQPLTQASLERAVMLIGDLPGITVRSVLSPSTGRAGSDLDIVLEQKTFAASLSVDNRGTRYMGPYQLNGRAELNNLLGWYDQTAVQVALVPDASELQYVAVTHSEPIGDDGARLTVHGLSSWSHPGDALTPLEMHGLGSEIGLDVSYPIERSRARTLVAHGGVVQKTSRINVLGLPFSKDRLSVLSLGASYDFSDAWDGSNLLRADLFKGLDVLGAIATGSPAASRFGGRSDFFRAEFSIARHQPIGDSWSLDAGIHAQWAPDPLLSSEQFGVGGRPYGRAFDASEISGDSGVAGGVEISYAPPPLLPDTKWQLFAFGDAGKVWLLDTPAPADTAELASVGAGVRIRIGQYIFASFELDVPLMRDVAAEGNRNVRPFFTIGAEY